jgi:hypothetical protein
MDKSINLGGVQFRLLTKAQAEPLLDELVDFEGDRLLDSWFSIPDDADEESYFLVADESTHMESLVLDVHLPGGVGGYVLGMIFCKDLHVEKGVVGFDTDHSPLLVVHGNLKAQNVYLFGNGYYVGGNLSCEALLGNYNHGALWVKGSAQASLVYSDDMDIYLGHIDAATTIHSLGGTEIQRRALPEDSTDRSSVQVLNQGRLAERVRPDFLEDRSEESDEGEAHQMELGWACAAIERGESLLIPQ